MLGPGDVRLPFLGIAICLFSRASTGLWAAEQAAVDAAIQRGRTHLVQQIKPGVAGNLGLYALVKLGFDKQDSAVQRAVKTIEERIVDGSYSPLQHHFYEAGIALMLGKALGMSAGNVALLMVLAASASYIAVPAVIRHAIPEANPTLYFGMSLGLTFPFNILLGIPLYVHVAQRWG